MNNGVTFSSKVDELRDVFVRHLFSFDWMRDSQIYARATFPITDAVLNVNNLAGHPERLKLQFKFMPNPLRKDFQTFWTRILSNPAYAHIMTKKIIMPAAWVTRVVSTGKKLTLGVGFYSLNNQAWELIKKEYETNPKFKDNFNDGLNGMIRHELYHVVDPTNYKGKDEYSASNINNMLSEVSNSGGDYHNALNERSTWTNDLVDGFWRLMGFYKEEGGNHDSFMIMDIIIDPRGFWKGEYGLFLGTSQMTYGQMLANATQAVYTSLEERGVSVADIMKKQGNNPTFSQRWQETFGSTNKPQMLNGLNPTGDKGGTMASYDHVAFRANAPLGPNMVTVDKTMGGSPDDLIRIYRGVDVAYKKDSRGNQQPYKIKPTINIGDYVTIYDYAARDYCGDWDSVATKLVRKGDLLDDRTEPSDGYEYIYRPEKAR